jgi:hypothetical protein
MVLASKKGWTFGAFVSRACRNSSTSVCANARGYAVAARRNFAYNGERTEKKGNERAAHAGATIASPARKRPSLA